MSQTTANNDVAAASNTASLNVSLTSGSSEIEVTCTFDIYYEYAGSNYYGVSPNTKTSGADKEITFEVEAPSGTNNFSTETNFDYNTSNGWVTENNKRKVKLVENASITNYGVNPTTQKYTFTGKYYNLNVSQEQLANKSFTGIIYVSKKECSNKELISFSINEVSYSAEKTMTWGQWLNSSYSKDFSKMLSKFTLNNDEYYYNGTPYTSYLVFGPSNNSNLFFTGEESCGENPGYSINSVTRQFKQSYNIINTLNDSVINLGSNKIYLYCFYTRCLTPETLIDVEEEDKKGKKRRKRKMLKDIKVGDKVICINPNTLKLDTDVVTECDSSFIKRHNCYDKWYFEDDIVIITVHRHRFYNVENKSFMYMDKWNIGEHGINIDGNKVKFIKHEHIEKEIVHVTLFTKKYNNYFANGMLSGNRRSKKINL